MTSLALLILRATVGGFLAGHGAQKLFGSFGGSGVEGTAGWMESMDLRPPRRWAILGGLSEFAGGLLTAVGALNPLGPIMAMGAMLMATLKVHLGKPVWVTSGGAELPIINMAALTTLFLAGPGRLSFDGLLGIRVPRWFSVVAMLSMVAVTYGAAVQSGLPETTDDDAAEAEEPSEAEGDGEIELAVESWGAADDEELPASTEDDQAIAATERTDAGRGAAGSPTDA